MQHNGMREMIRGLGWDLGLPLVTYYGLHAAGASDTAALLAGTAGAALRMAWVAVRSRTLSPFSMVMAAVFGVGLLFTVLTGDPRFLIIKHSAMAAAIGLAFLITALHGGRPLTLAAQQSFMPGKADDLTAAYATNPDIRRGHRLASLVWGGGLLTEAAIRAVLVYLLPIEVMVGVSTALTVVTFAILIAWNARYLATHRPTPASAPASAPVSAPAPASASAPARAAAAPAPALL
jgi:hypothetical protein